MQTLAVTFIRLAHGRYHTQLAFGVVLVLDFLELRRQPVEALVQTLSARRASALDIPGAPTECLQACSTPNNRERDSLSRDGFASQAHNQCNL